MITSLEHRGGIALRLSLVRGLLAAIGALGLWLAWTVDLAFVEQVVLGRPVGDLAMASVLLQARALLAVAASGLIVLGVLLPHVLASSVVHRLLAARRSFRWLVFGLPLGLVATIALWKSMAGLENPLYLLLVREDSVAEYLTAVVYFAAAGLALWLVRRLLQDPERLPALMFGVLTCLFLFVALEEISYGQRIFGLATPEVMAQHNLQREISIHNLAALKPLFFDIGPILVGVGGAVAWLLLGFRHRLPHPLPDLVLYAVPPWFASSYFLLYAAYWVGSEVLGWREYLIWQDQELAELILAGGFLIIVVNGLVMHQAQRSWSRGSD